MPSMQVKQEKSTSEAPSVDSDTDSDDSVIHVPFVKPRPPVVNLVESDDDDDDDDCEARAQPASATVDEKQNKTETASSNDVETVRWEISTRPSGVSVDVPENRRQKKRQKEKDKSQRDTMTAAEKKRLEKKERRKQKLSAKQGEESERLNNSQTCVSPKKKKRRQQAEEPVNNVENPGEPEPVANASSEPSGRTTEKESTVSTVVSPTKKKSRSKSASSAGEASSVNDSTTAEPKRKRTRRKTLTAAERDHLNFLKTLNLTGNIGFDENDMLNMALSPADFVRPSISSRQNRLTEKIRRAREDAGHDSDTSNTTISTDIDPRESVRPLQETAVDGEGPSVDPASGQSIPEEMSEGNTVDIADRSTQTAFVVVTEEKSKKNKKRHKLKGLAPQVVDAVSTSPTEKHRKPSSPDSSQLNDMSKKKDTPSKVPEASCSDVPVAPAIVHVAVETSSSPNKRKGKNTEEIPLHPADEDDGVFTHQELNELQSSIRLNITGVNDGPHSSDERSTDDEVDDYGKHVDMTVVRNETAGQKSKKSLRYFTPQSGETSEKPNKGIQDNEVEGRMKKRRRKDGIREHDNRAKRRRTDRINRSQAELDHTSSYVDDEAAVREAENNQGYGYRSFPTTWTENMKQFYGAIRGSGIDVRDVVSKQNASPRLWRIPKDLEPQRRKGKKIKCMNCNNYGYHVAATCPEPRREIVCIMCGNTGHKTGCMYTNDRNWPKNRPRLVRTSCRRILCLNCGRTPTRGRGNAFLQACEACTKAKFNCDCCGSSGHRADSCPDNWRRFHSTTVDYDDKNLQNLVRNNQFTEPLQKTLYRPKCEEFCSNCSRKGHNYYHCGDYERNFSAMYPVVKPYVVQELPISVLSRPNFSVENALNQPNTTSDDIIIEEVNKDTRPSSNPTSSKKSRKEKSRSKSEDRHTSKRKPNERESPTSVEKHSPEERSKSALGRCSRELSTAMIPPENSAGAESIQATVPVSRDASPSTQVALSGCKSNTDVVQEGTAAHVTVKNVQVEKNTVALLSSNSLHTPLIEPPSNLKLPQGVSEQSERIKEKETVERASSPEVVVLEDDSDDEIIVLNEVATPELKDKSVAGRISPKKTFKDRPAEAFVGKCTEFPDCQNVIPPSGPPCFKLIVMRKEHGALLELDSNYQLVKKLNEHYKTHKVSISLCRKKLEFHIGGSQYYFARDRICRLIKEVTKETDVRKLLPELFPGRLPSSSVSVSEAIVSSSTEVASEKTKSVDEGHAEHQDSVKDALIDNQEVSQSILEPSKSLDSQNKPSNPIASPLQSLDRLEESERKDGESPANPMFSRYDFEKRLRKIAVQVASTKPAETVTSTDGPTSPDTSVSSTPVAVSDSYSKETLPENADSVSKEPQLLEERNHQERREHLNYNRRGIHGQRRNNRRRGRGQMRFSPGYPERSQRQPERSDMAYSYSPPPHHDAPHDIDERYLPPEERTRANPFNWPNSPFSNPWMGWGPYGMPPGMRPPPPYQPNFAMNDFNAVCTPDGFIMDRQFFTGPNGMPLFNPADPPPRPRYHPN